MENHGNVLSRREVCLEKEGSDPEMLLRNPLVGVIRLELKEESDPQPSSSVSC